MYTYLGLNMILYECMHTRVVYLATTTVDILISSYMFGNHLPVRTM